MDGSRAPCGKSALGAGRTPILVNSSSRPGSVWSQLDLKGGRLPRLLAVSFFDGFHRSWTRWNAFSLIGAHRIRFLGARSTGRLRIVGVHDSRRKLLRRRSGSPGLSRVSRASWVLVQTGTATVSTFLPRGVNSSKRARWSSHFLLILIRLRRCSGLSAAVKVVRSMASNDATAPMLGASGRFKDINSENCPCVKSRGRNAWSKHRASDRAARCT